MVSIGTMVTFRFPPLFFFYMHFFLFNVLFHSLSSIVRPGCVDGTNCTFELWDDVSKGKLILNSAQLLEFFIGIPCTIGGE